LTLEKDAFIAASIMSSQYKASMDDSSSDSTDPEKPHVLDSQSRGDSLAKVPTQPSPPVVDGEDLINLPSRTLSNNAQLNEYTQETINGQILKEVQSNRTGRTERYELVTWKINDPENPKNWSKAYKWWCTMTVAMTCFVVAFNSAVITADVGGVAKSFDVSEEVALLTITLFVVGFGVGKLMQQNLLHTQCSNAWFNTGPMIFAPISEIVGRRPIYAFTLFIATVFIIPCAVAENISTILVCRLIDGIAFSAPMTLVGGTLADLWRTEERGIPMAAFSAAPFIGPAIGPLVGGFLADSKGWRWLYWIQLILSGAVWFLITFTVPETYAPRLLARRARKLRSSTGDSRYVTEQDLDLRPLSQRLRLFLLRPFQLLFQELIVFFLSLYMSVLYGLLYMFFVAYPIVYQGGKGYSASTTGLM